MAGLSFLVSPQAQADAEAQSRAFTAGFQEQVATQRAQDQLETQEAIEERRTQAAEARADARQKALFQMEANREDARAKLVAQQTAKQFTLSQLQGFDKTFHDLMGTTRSQIRAMNNFPDRYDPTKVQQYAQELQNAQAADSTAYSSWRSNFLKHAQDGDAPDFDFSQLQSYKLSTAPANPLIDERIRQNMALAQRSAEDRAKNLELAKQRLQLQGTRLSMDQWKSYDTFANASAKYDAATGALSGYLAATPNPDPYQEQQLRNNVQQAYQQYAGAAAVVHSHIAAGLYGPTLQKSLQSVMQNEQRAGVTPNDATDMSGLFSGGSSSAGAASSSNAPQSASTPAASTPAASTPAPNALDNALLPGGSGGSFFAGGGF